MCDVDVAVKKARVTVKATSEAANTILREVVAATESMAASSAVSLESFETFINEEGESVQRGLDAHFLSLRSHLGAQEGAVSALGSAGQEVRDLHVQGLSVT